MKPKLDIKVSNIAYRFQPESSFNLAIGDLKHRFDGALGMYGLSGSGKTTFSKILAGIVKPQIGDLHFSFKNGAVEPPKILYSPQFPEKIFLGVRVSDTVQQIVAQNPLKTDLHEHINFYLDLFLMSYDSIKAKCGFELSGGELRRFAISLSLAMSPDLLILDEPTIGMGHKGKNQLYSVLEDFQRQHHVLIVSHDFELIRKTCKHFWILHRGSLIFNGNLIELDSQHNIKKQVGIHLFEMYFHRSIRQLRGQRNFKK